MKHFLKKECLNICLTRLQISLVLQIEVKNMLTFHSNHQCAFAGHLLNRPHAQHEHPSKVSRKAHGMGAPVYWWHTHWWICCDGQRWGAWLGSELWLSLHIAIEPWHHFCCKYRGTITKKRVLKNSLLKKSNC